MTEDLLFIDFEALNKNMRIPEDGEQFEAVDQYGQVWKATVVNKSEG